MNRQLILAVLAVGATLLTGCAETSTLPTTDSSPGFIPKSSASDNPPVTMSGYVDTSVTTQAAK